MTAVRGRRIGIVAGLLSLLLVVSGVGTAEAAPATTTIRGVVTDAGKPVAGVAVGFVTTGRKAGASGRSDASGAFVLTVPSSARGFVWAGQRPDSKRAVFLAAGVKYVRGAIGAVRPAGPAAVLAAPSKAETATGIRSAGTVRFRLLRAGRISITDAAFAGGVGNAELLTRDGKVAIASMPADAAGRMVGRWVVPGTYSVLLQPPAPLLSARLARVEVVAGATTPVAPPAFRRGATLSGAVTSAGAGVAVPVSVLDGDRRVVATTESAADGTYAIAGLDRGTYRVVFGAHYDIASAPTSVSPTALVAERRVVVGADRADLRVDTALAPAAVITGKASRVRGAVAVVAERPDGAVVAETTAGASGDFRLGGLTPGVRYRIVTLTGGGSAQRWGSRTIVPAAGIQAIADVDTGASRLLLLSGAAAGVTEVAVRAADGLHGSVQVKDGRYRIQVVPGRYTVVTTAPGRLDRTVTVAVTAATERDLRPGAKTASATARLVGTGTLRPPTGLTATSRGVEVGFATADGPGAVALNGQIRAGRYRLLSTGAGTPVIDGPWSFVAPTTAFTLRAGQTTDLGVVRLRVAAG